MRRVDRERVGEKRRIRRCCGLALAHTRGSVNKSAHLNCYNIRVSIERQEMTEAAHKLLNVSTLEDCNFSRLKNAR